MATLIVRREITWSEWVADAVVHVVGVSLGCAACIVLSIVALPFASPAEFVGLVLYSAGLMLMLTASALFNIASRHSLNAWFCRLDQAAIFLMIAGTYSPFMLVSLGHTLGFSMFAFVWTGAIAGAVLMIVAPVRNPKIDVALYLVLGWTAVFATGPLLRAISPPGLILIGLGGLLYTIGVFFHMSTRVRFNKAIWHTFVLAAAGCHFAAVIVEIVAGGAHGAVGLAT